MKPDNLILKDDKRIDEIKQLVESFINKGGKYKFEKMKPDKLLLINDERNEEIKQIIEKYIKRGEKYKIEKINDVVYFEKVNQIQESNLYICSVSLSLKDSNNNNDLINEEFLIEEDIPSGKKSFRYVIYRNPNI